MAEEHQIEARILLRYDTYSRWMNSTLILLKGEAAICSFPTSHTLENMSNDYPFDTPPAIGIKIGDGLHRFYELPWVQGVAADVYSWAKQQTKPQYTASEIQGLENFIKQFLSGDDVAVEAKAYQIIQGTGDNSNKYYLQSRGANDTDWVTDTAHPIDLTSIMKVVNWIGADVDTYFSLGSRTQEHIELVLSGLSYQDSSDGASVVTAVSQSNGKINVTKSQLNFNQLNGLVDVAHGGTGKVELPQGEVLIGNGTGAVKTVEISTELENTQTLVYGSAVKRYIDNATAGLTGAMHYIGEASVDMSNASNKAVDPQIPGYIFKNAQPGDVVTFDHKEYVWTGTEWRLLGDEGNYVIKGAITEADFSPEINLPLNKIEGLYNLLDTKVDKVEGKALSTNDFTTEYKQKLDDIEENAQRNLIEHIYINGTEAIPSVIDGKANSLAIRLSSLTPEEEEKLRGIEQNAQVNTIEHVFLNEEELTIKTVKTLPKSVNIELIPYTEQEQQKLADIQAGAQVNTIQSISVNGVPVSPTADKVVDIVIPDHAEHANKIEKIFLNGVEQVPDSDKYINIQIDESAVSFTVLKGARVPTGIAATPYEDIDLDETTKKLEFAKIAKTGWVYDIVNTPANNTTDYLILRCGDSTTLVD